jgi:hypothetical protein
MGFIQGLFNGSKGSNWEAGNVAIDKPSTVQQAGQAYDNTQAGLSQQMALLQALQGQNGIQNQAGVFNQLQGVANGTGPNPAQAMLNNATGQNVANQAALMAGQRGASANAGLIARQAAQQGANLQQQAVGQGASLQASQGLNALNTMGGIANQQVANQAQATGAYNQFAQGQQSNLLNGIGQQNNAAVAMQSNVNNTNGALAGVNAGAQDKAVGGVLNGIGGALSSLFAHGGVVRMADGGVTPPPPMQPEQQAPIPAMQDDKKSGGPNPMMLLALLNEGGQVKSSGPRSKVAIHLHGAGSAKSPAMMSTGGNVPALVSPGEKVLSPAEAKQVAQGASINDMGKKVPGKAPVKGDSLKNDIVPAKLQEGGMVIPKSVMESDDPVKHAIAFVRAHMSKQGAMKNKKA